MEGGGLEEEGEEEEEEMRRQEPSIVERSIRAFHTPRISEASTDPPFARLRSHRPAQPMARITPHHRYDDLQHANKSIFITLKRHVNKSERANRENKTVMEDGTDERGGERDEDGSMGRLPWQPSVSTQRTHAHALDVTKV